MILELTPHLVAENERVRLVTGGTENGLLSFLDIVDWVGGRIIVPGVDKSDVGVPDTRDEVIARPLNLLPKQHLLCHETSSIAERVEGTIGVGNHLVVNVLVQGEDIAVVVVGTDVVSGTGRLGRWRASLGLITEPIVLRVDVVEVTLLVYRNDWEHLRGNEVGLFLDVSHGDLRQNRVYVNLV